MNVNETKYTVLGDGRVYSYSKKRYLKIRKNSSGRGYVQLFVDKRRRTIYVDDLVRKYNEDVPNIKFLFKKVPTKPAPFVKRNEISYLDLLFNDNLIYNIFIILLLYIYFIVKESTNICTL